MNEQPGTPRDVSSEQKAGPVTPERTQDRLESSMELMRRISGIGEEGTGLTEQELENAGKAFETITEAIIAGKGYPEIIGKLREEELETPLSTGMGLGLVIWRAAQQQKSA